MSKIKKKRIEDLTTISELDTSFEKIIQFSGWLFLLLLAGYMGVWLFLDSILKIMELELTAISFSFILFTGTNSAISFALTTKIKNNRDKKKQFFLDWLVGEFIFCILAIFSVAVYQW